MRYFLLSLLFVAGCASQQFPDRSITLGEIFELRVGERVRIGGGGDILRFAGIEEDSRCPTGATCVWEGNAKAVLEHRFINQDPQAFALNTLSERRRDTVINNLKITLLEVLPVPTVGSSIAPEDYRLRLVLDRP